MGGHKLTQKKEEALQQNVGQPRKLVRIINLLYFTLPSVMRNKKCLTHLQVERCWLGRQDDLLDGKSDRLAQIRNLKMKKFRRLETCQ